jgi:hypothetical protein
MYFSTLGAHITEVGGAYSAEYPISISPAHGDAHTKQRFCHVSVLAQFRAFYALFSRSDVGSGRGIRRWKGLSKVGYENFRITA